MPENNKKSFIMYSNYRKFLSKLPDKDIADLIKAIFCFVEEEEVPELSPSAELCFIIISDQIKRDMEKYEKVCEQRAIAGRLGGKRKHENRLKMGEVKEGEKEAKKEEKIEEKESLANVSKCKQMLANVSKASKCKQTLANVSKRWQTLANLADNENDNDNDIAIDKNITIDINNNKKKTKQKKSGNYSTEFECFWEVYPRKSDKGEAYKKYLTRLKDGWSPEQLLTAAKKYRAQIVANRTDQRYIKLCKTFLSDTTPFTDYLTRTERQGEKKDTENPYEEWEGSANG